MPRSLCCTGQPRGQCNAATAACITSPYICRTSQSLPAYLLGCGLPVIDFGATDHIVAKSVYLNDPDGIGLEIAFETPERVRSYRWDRGAERPLVIDSDGRRRDGVEPLAIQDVLAKLPNGDIKRPLPSGTTVGHLQFQVADLEASYRFYSDRIGLVPSMYAPWSGYGDLGAAGRVAHRIALNTWQGVGVPPRPLGMAGMRSFTMRFQSREWLMDAVA